MVSKKMVRVDSTGQKYELTHVKCNKGGISCTICEVEMCSPGRSNVFNPYCRTSVGRSKPAKVWRKMDPLYEALMEVKEADSEQSDNTTKARI
jgi:hypothetical protein